MSKIKVLFSLMLAWSLCGVDANASKAGGSVSRLQNHMEQELGRRLTSAELSRLAEFQTFALNNRDALQPQVAELDSDELPTLTTPLLCVGVKLALGGRWAGARCWDSSGQAYNLNAFGAGIALGASLSGSILIHRGPLGSVRGSYAGASVGKASGQALLAATRIRSLLTVLGPDFGIYLRDDAQSYLILAGATLGPMVDLTGQVLELH